MFFDLLLRRIPDWVLPFAFGMLLWGGLHYVYLSERIVSAYVQMDCPAQEQRFCACAARSIMDADKLRVTAWTASFSLISANSEAIRDAREQVTKSGRYSAPDAFRRYDCDRELRRSGQS